MVNKIKASLEISLLVFIMSCFIIGIGIYGVIEIRSLNKSANELYNDRIIPMDELGDVRYFNSVIIATAHQASKEQISYSESLAKIKSAQDSIRVNWKKYLQTSLTPKENQIATKVDGLLDKSLTTIDRLELIMQNKDKAALDNILKNEIKSDLNPVEQEISNLLRLQVEVAKNIYRDETKVYTGYTRRFLWILFFALAFAIPFCYYLIKKNAVIINSYNLNNAKLFLTEKNYRNLIEYAGEAILILNEETEIIDLNEYAIQLLGYSRDEILLMKIAALVAPEDIKKQTLDINEVRKNKYATIYRKVRRKDGSYIETEISNRLMEGKGFFAIVRDITERKKAEAFIMESEEKYRYLFNNNPAYIIIWDPETLAVLEVNETVLLKYGYSKEEWNTMTVLDYRPAEEHENIKKFARYMLSGDEPIAKSNWRHFKKNGEEMIMEIASHKIKYNNKQAILSLANDVTEKVKTEASLIEREAQLNLFIAHSPASLAMLDTDLRYIATSKRWITDYNLTEQNIIGKSHYEVFPEIGEEWKKIHQRCLTGVSEKREEDTFVRADGSVDWLRWEIHPWYKANSEIGGLLFFTEVITERKRATEMFKNQFENSPDTILYINKNLKIEAINRGNPSGLSKEKLVGADCIEVLPEESRTIAREAIMKCFETGEKQEIENALLHNRWVRSRMVPIVTNNEITHVMLFVSDMTERKAAEEKLVQSEEKYRALTENVSDAIVLVNEVFEIEYQSPSSERIAGYGFEETKAKTIFGFIHPDDLVKGELFFNEVLNTPGTPMNNQFRVIHKLGHVIWVEGTVLNLLDNGNIKAIIINYRDITNRKRDEEQLALTASIVNSSDDAIISKTLEGIIMSWNKGAEKTLGYTAEEIIGKHISVLIPLDYRGEEVRIIEEIKKGKSVEHYETQRMKKNGDLIYVSLTISPITDATGKVIGVSKIMRDITDSKKFEEDLIHYNEELKKTNSELDRFVYSTSHDLRAPLKSMLGLIDITKNDIEEDNAHDKAILIQRFEMLNRSATKLDNFIEDILSYSRNARMELECNEINFKDLITDINGNFVFSQTGRQIDFKVDIHTNYKFFSDAKRLTVVLNNILSNAYKYCDPSEAKSFIKVAFNCDSQSAKITIEDNGIGIPEEEKGKIFDMFYRSTLLSTGSGLGLYIVKETLQKMNGKIQVVSEVNKGTTFFIEIPNQINASNG